MSETEIGCRAWHTFQREVVKDFVSVWNGRDPLNPSSEVEPAWKECLDVHGVPSTEPYLSPAQKEVLSYLRSRGGEEFGPQDIARAVGRSEAGVKEALLWLWRRGRYGVTRRRVANERTYGGPRLKYRLVQQ